MEAIYFSETVTFNGLYGVISQKIGILKGKSDQKKPLGKHGNG
jgi:hypothetical protein